MYEDDLELGKEYLRETDDLECVGCYDKEADIKPYVVIDGRIYCIYEKCIHED